MCLNWVLPSTAIWTVSAVPQSIGEVQKATQMERSVQVENYTGKAHIKGQEKSGGSGLTPSETLVLRSIVIWWSVLMIRLRNEGEEVGLFSVGEQGMMCAEVCSKHDLFPSHLTIVE